MNNYSASGDATSDLRSALEAQLGHHPEVTEAALGEYARSRMKKRAMFDVEECRRIIKGAASTVAKNGEVADAERALERLLAGGIEPFFDHSFTDGWDDPEPETDWIVPGLIASDSIHWASGEHATLKTTVGAWACRQALEAGRDAVWLDYEVGTVRSRKRFKVCGVTRAQAEHGFHYRYQPPVTTNDASVERLRESVAGLRQPLVVIDSMSKALAHAGCNENDAGEVSKFTEAVLQRALKGAGATVYVIDHVGRHQLKSSNYVARGSSTKDADADITYRFVVEAQPNHETVGQLRLLCQKDRDDVLSGTGAWSDSRMAERGERWFSVGDGKGNLPVVPIDQPDQVRQANEENRLRADIVAFLRENPQDSYSIRGLRDELRGAGISFSNQEVGPAVRNMGREDIYPVEVTGGANGEKLEVRYREGDGENLGF